jgi:hypothetical protein
MDWNTGGNSNRNILAKVKKEVKNLNQVGLKNCQK